MSTKLGESFPIDPSSRVNVLDQSIKFPEYVHFSRDIRKLLKGTTEDKDYSQKENWPECPKDSENLDEFFEAARTAVTKRWQQVVPEVLQSKYQGWLKQIPQTEEYQDVINLLNNPQELEDKLRMMQFGELEPLKQVLPEAWRDLLLASSERQLATLALLRHWVKSGFTEEATAKLGVNQSELGLMLDASGILGKYIDHAYVK